MAKFKKIYKLIFSRDKFGYPKLGFRVLETPLSNGLKAHKLNKDFLLFWVHLMIFQSGAALQNFEKSSNMPKIEENPCSNVFLIILVPKSVTTYILALM